jgi:nitrogen fixation protein NifU and related proteins
VELDALYAEVILDHNRAPRNWGELPDARRVEGHNPMCGDRLTLWLDLDGDVIRDVRFTGEGCAISKASASMMTQAIKGKTRAEAEALFERFHSMVTGGPVEQEDRDALGSLRAFSGVSRFPIRVKCASLAWHALRQALATTRDEGRAPSAEG